jgi:hypothetical protein
METAWLRLSKLNICVVRLGNLTGAASSTSLKADEEIVQVQIAVA